MRVLQSFVALFGKQAIRAQIVLEDGTYTLRDLTGTIIPTLPERVMTVAMLRQAMERREIATGHRSSLLTTSTVGLPNHVWKTTETLFDLIERNPWDFRPSVVKAVIDGLNETYAEAVAA